MASPKKCSAGKVLRRSHRRSGKLVKAMCVKKAGKHSARKHSARKHSARKHSVRKHSARKHSARKHSVRKHSSRKHSARKCSPGKVWRKSHMRSGKRVAAKCVKKSVRKM